MTGEPAGSLAGTHVAVTGATGFVGTHLVRALAQAGAQVTAIAPVPGWRVPVEELSAIARFVPCDPLSADTTAAELAAATEGAELLVHLAYQPPPTGDGGHFEAVHNLAGSLRLVSALPPTTRHICFASSVMVYGSNPPLPVAESACPRPVTSYAVAKLAAEHFLRGWTAQSGRAVSVLRLATVYGPLETVPRAVPNFIRRALAGEPPVIRGDGKELRDYVHVDDVVAATLLALARPPSGCDTFNIGSGQGRSTVDVARHVATLTGTSMPAVHVDAPGTAASIVCDIGHARRTLGYSPTVGFEDGLRSEISWFASGGDRRGIDEPS